MVSVAGLNVKLHKLYNLIYIYEPASTEDPCICAAIKNCWILS